MKIVYLAAGAAGMYCGSCLHDNTLAAALLRNGTDVLLVPTYTPLRTDEENVSQSEVLYGGINVYLQQKLFLFRYTPWIFDRLLNSRPLMRWLAGRRAAVDAKRLGDLTLSMLRGPRGRQAKELKKLIAWIGEVGRPDVVHLSNALLLGMAGEIRRELGARVVCGLSGEDIFVDALPQAAREQTLELMRQLAPDADAFVALNRYYAEFMTDELQLDRRRVHVIPHGVRLDGYPDPAAPRPPRSPGEPLTIGYFARICPEKGLHLLVEAFGLLAADPNLPPLRLRAAGYRGSGDLEYFHAQENKLKSLGLLDRFEYLGEPSRAEKIEIIRSFDVMSVPTVYRESKGLSILEALAAGVPVVQPAHGSFPEIVESTGGGLLFEPENPQDLARALRRLILDSEERAALGRRGQAEVHRRYHAQQMADETLALYRRVMQGEAPAADELAGSEPSARGPASNGTANMGAANMGTANNGSAPGVDPRHSPRDEDSYPAAQTAPVDRR